MLQRSLPSSLNDFHTRRASSGWGSAEAERKDEAIHTSEIIDNCAPFALDGEPREEYWVDIIGPRLAEHFCTVKIRKLFLFKIAHSQNRREYISTEYWIIWIRTRCSRLKITNSHAIHQTEHLTPLIWWVCFLPLILYFAVRPIVGLFYVQCLQFTGVHFTHTRDTLFQMQQHYYYLSTKHPRFRVFITHYCTPTTIRVNNNPVRIWYLCARFTVIALLWQLSTYTTYYDHPPPSDTHPRTGR